MQLVVGAWKSLHFIFLIEPPAAPTSPAGPAYQDLTGRQQRPPITRHHEDWPIRVHTQKPAVSCQGPGSGAEWNQIRRTEVFRARAAGRGRKGARRVYREQLRRFPGPSRLFPGLSGAWTALRAARSEAPRGQRAVPPPLSAALTAKGALKTAD
ncbi:hypothetical protein EYF80_030313 [Liparis tanakae]|uniref:Uncharacterized protein n=1 Tax=Liparis tanakae TaxID=230148 RepID=A0A4Z2H0X7_9TELE|nr:hypothetical protein EYF80_030313 [Liparis tanakae]